MDIAEICGRGQWLLLRRQLLLKKESDEEMKEWTVLYDETFTEDTDKVVIEDAKYEEVEAYIFIKTKLNTNDSLYLTSESNGNIFSEPRANSEVKNSWIGIRKLSLKKITNFLWETESQVSNYFASPLPAISPLIGYTSIIMNNELDIEKTNGITLKYQNGTKFQIGDRIFIRAR